jgi:hypothetical protein
VRQLPCNPGWHMRPAFGFWLGERPLGLDGQPLDREPEVW